MTAHNIPDHHHAGSIAWWLEGEGEADDPAGAGVDSEREPRPPEVPPGLDVDELDVEFGVVYVAPPVEERFRERLAAQIATFLGELSSTTFAERCTATQMVQAVSFPLAVALRGQGRGWVTADLAEKWALEVFSILFRGKTSGSGGLLRAVEHRYVQNDQKAIFDDVVGDGTLWMVLVATLGNANWQGVGTDIDKAVALREVFTAPQLLATLHPGELKPIER